LVAIHTSTLLMLLLQSEQGEKGIEEYFEAQI
jgi:hypothetical protein